jgi:hypothetical protein
VTAAEEFSSWRVRNAEVNGWGLAWFLANEFCRRFYSSHGIRPTVINHDGLGYYGIGLEPVACKPNGGSVKTLGRLTISGDVENWRSGDPGDHGLETIELCGRGVATEELIEKAIRHMRLPVVPEKSHLGCRHQRWGDSYAVCFELATILALRHEIGGLSISNAAEEVNRKLALLDAKASMREHPGAFLFRREEHEVLLTGDGRLLGGSPLNLWQLYMQGKSVGALAGTVEERIGMSA